MIIKQSYDGRDRTALFLFLNTNEFIFINGDHVQNNYMIKISVNVNMGDNIKD